MPEAYYKSPFGWLKLKAGDEALNAIEFIEGGGYTSGSDHPVLKETLRQLDEYFKSERKTFDLKLEPEGTPFQKRVWNELLKIPFGSTITYLELARRLGDEKVIRAAGTANGRNPIPVVIPCHRVIGSSGKLVGYAGGLQIKEWLLRHEGSFMELF
ncbi:MAG: methylated-DNA--[protein]-cysteine S-methyltransferase [Ignavibacteria bacterium]|jgi:methylated-DNA-[protein]-cysteine S-methyltransferase|nr:methylated-DNA--[protein]-cysteine S-methyltransferase [Ignavibacteria bacterium]MCU7498256.1 methylated-DNA--[protein]-cysteine S-methyltransferase [Ignavibacteria bacterium]MCU7511252.1 methylated-DNA--[protein]-cysteine S-methyltransferase [Ignavibacteria bacterium]MCU7519026.1 methylated-DNA--[protein]-cysteine S-methyltransferase [Ignavibacteria bacterium]MCU7523307.1 methylated-DNA--[protein]-cysteine S-methyltransferase [Ignavibacteria bacterium]